MNVNWKGLLKNVAGSLVDYMIQEQNSQQQSQQQQQQNNNGDKIFSDLHSHCKTLGINNESVWDEEFVKSVYKIRMKKAHPDNGGSDEECRKIQEAYDYVCNWRNKFSKYRKE